MTDAKELAAEHAEALRNIGQDVLSVAELGMLRRAAAALEAQAEESERLARRLRARAMISADADDLVRSAQLQSRLAALEQAAAPFVLAESMARVLIDDFDSVPDDEPFSITPITVGSVRALARAAGGGE